MNNQRDTVHEDTQPVREDDAGPPPASARAPETDEFELTIRKLELPARPRGVLAE